MSTNRAHSHKCLCCNCRNKTDVEKYKKAEYKPVTQSETSSFDSNLKFGPCSGISRHERVIRALSLNLGLSEELAARLLNEPDERYGFSK